MGSEIIRDVSGIEFSVGPLRFRELLPDSSERKTNAEHVLILKSPNFLRKYDDVFGELPSKNVVEFGIAEGGSLLYFAQAFPQYKYVGIDLRPPNESVLKHIETLGLTNIKLYYNTNQADIGAVNSILQENFRDEELGCVIDDASHMYELSRRTFECTFARLAKGGKFCLEDWSWAHESGEYQTTKWLSEPALSNLLFEILILMPSTRSLIEFVTVDYNMAVITRGGGKFSSVALDTMLLIRDRKISLV